MNHPLMISSLLVLSISTNANAIVNMDSLHLKNIKKGISGTIKVNSNGSYGNSERFVIQSSAEVLAKKERALNYFSINYSYGESFSREDQHKSYTHIRHVNDVEKSSTWELYTQAEENKFARLKFRGLVGAGFRWRFLIDSEKSSSILGAGAYYSRIELTDSDAIEVKHQNVHRANIYWVYKTSIFDNMTLFNTTYYQPEIQTPEDFRILEIAGFKITLTKTLSFSVYGEGTFDSKPPEGVKKGDLSYKTGLEYKF